MILHASIQLFSRTAPRKQEFSTARKATAGATLLARVDFIRNVGEPFEGVRELPFPTGARLSIYAHTTGSFVFPLAKSRPPRCARTHHRTTPSSLSLFLHSQQIHHPCSSGDCQRSDRYINISPKLVPLARSMHILRLILYFILFLLFEMYLFRRDTSFHELMEICDVQGCKSNGIDRNSSLRREDRRSVETIRRIIAILEKTRNNTSIWE